MKLADWFTVAPLSHSWGCHPSSQVLLGPVIAQGFAALSPLACQLLEGRAVSPVHAQLAANDDWMDRFPHSTPQGDREPGPTKAATVSWGQHGPRACALWGKKMKGPPAAGQAWGPGVWMGTVCKSSCSEHVKHPEALGLCPLSIGGCKWLLNNSILGKVFSKLYKTKKKQIQRTTGNYRFQQK